MCQRQKTEAAWKHRSTIPNIPFSGLSKEIDIPAAVVAVRAPDCVYVILHPCMLLEMCSSGVGVDNLPRSSVFLSIDTHAI